MVGIHDDVQSLPTASPIYTLLQGRERAISVGSELERGSRHLLPSPNLSPDASVIVHIMNGPVVHPRLIEVVVYC